MSDNVNGWMDFAQRSRDDGGLGLEKHQAAGLVGNLVNESGPNIDAWGRPGDDGTAWGSAQWRGDRLTGLQNHARENGLDYRTPEAQQSWMRHEFDTTHSGAYDALRASTTPEQAATAVNQHYEVSADRSGHREASARRLYDGTDGPTAIQNAMGGTRSQPRSTAMGFAATDDEDTQPALRPQVPQGALTAGGSPVSGQSWLDVLGQTLKDMAPGIAQDPEHAKALEASAAGSRKVADQGTWSHFVTPNGQLMRIRSKDGMVQQLPGNYAAEKEDPGLVERKKAEAKASTDRFNALQDGVSTADDQLRNIAELRRAVQNPGVTFGGLGDTAASAKNLAYSLGIDVKGLDDTQIVQRLATKMQLSQGKLLPGAISNYEDKLLGLANGVGVDKSREANLAALDAQEAIYKHQKAYAAEAQKYKAEHGMLDDGWFAHSSKWAAENQPQYRQPAAAPPAAGKRPPLTDIFK